MVVVQVTTGMVALLVGAGLLKDEVVTGAEDIIDDELGALLEAELDTEPEVDVGDGGVIVGDTGMVTVHGQSVMVRVVESVTV